MIGPVQRAILAELAASNLTVAEIAELTGCISPTAHRAVGSLARKRYAVILRYRHTGRNRAAVWGATEAGRRALAAYQYEGVAS